MRKFKVKQTRVKAINRPIEEIIIHCSDTEEGLDYKANDIDNWHRDRGFEGIGYHYVVDLDGTIELGRDLQRAGAHVKDHNYNSIGICYIGGRDSNGEAADTRTGAQKQALRNLLQVLLSVWPHAHISGHRDWTKSKKCPCFDAAKEYADLNGDVYVQGNGR
jgi:N-acetylmuramoyl-L-alanine amidase